MELESFVKNIAEQFEEIDTTGFNPKTKFRKNEEWSSMTAIAVVSMIEDEYGIMLNINDLKPMNTIEELFNFVKGKI